MLTSTWNISMLAAHLLVFRFGLNEKANSFLPLGAAFWSGKNSGFLGNAVHKAALGSQMLLYQAIQGWWNKNKNNRTNHAD